MLLPAPVPVVAEGDGPDAAAVNPWAICCRSLVSCRRRDASGGLFFTSRPRLGDQLLGASLLVGRHTISEFAQLPLNLVGHRVRMVGNLDLFAAALVLVRMRLLRPSPCGRSLLWKAASIR